MRFCIFALSLVPDLATARRVLDLSDLDDRSVGKVLFHNRKQRGGANERLRWDQRMIAGMTLIGHSGSDTHIDSMNLSTHSEEAMLDAFYAAALRDERIISWHGERDGLPLIHFRSLMHRTSFPAYWQNRRVSADMHLDLATWLTPPNGEYPELDETARKMGLPGLLGWREEGLGDARAQQHIADVQAYCDLAAINIYLLALRLFAVTGELTGHEAAQAEMALRDRFGRHDSGHLADFLTAWSTD